MNELTSKGILFSKTGGLDNFDSRNDRRRLDAAAFLVPRHGWIILEKWFNVRDRRTLRENPEQVIRRLSRLERRWNDLEKIQIRCSFRATFYSLLAKHSSK